MAFFQAKATVEDAPSAVLEQGDGNRRHAFAGYARRLTRRHGRILSLVVAVSGIVSWPIDLWLFPQQSQVLLGLALARGVGCSIAAGCALALRPGKGADHQSATESDPFPVLFVTMLLCSLVTGAGYTIAGGLDLLTFQSIAFAPLATVPMVWTLPRRTLVATLIVVTFLGTTAVLGASYFPQELFSHQAFGVTCANAGLGILTSVVLGEMGFRLVKRDFHSERSLSRLNQDLEALVVARTERIAELANHLETMREKERHQLARELHDETGQLLTALRMEVGVVRRRALAATGTTGGGVAALEESLSHIEGLLDQTLTSTRELVQSLRPRILDDYGLGAAAEWLLERFCRQSSLAVDWEVDLGDGQVTGEPATAAFRVLQESLTNVARHAKASHVVVRLSAQGDEVVLSVSDNGVGFSCGDGPRRGFGILGMEERARALGGQFSMSNAGDSGAVVALRIPLPGKTP